MRKVLVIDDDKITHKFIAKSLKDNYELIDAFNGEEGIKSAKGYSPDVILLDVEMPGMNGYEVCDHLKHSSLTKDIPVVFLSSHSSVRERMQGYEAGAADYMVKPFVPEDLQAKLKVLSQYREEQTRLQKQYAEAKSTAITAMSGSNELGQIMLFVEKSHHATSFELLSRQILEVTSKLQLNVVLRFSVAQKEYWFGTDEAISPLEKQLATMLAAERRIYDFGCRTQLNFACISMLIKNMPLSDRDRYGRLKDVLASMLSVADARARSLITEQSTMQQAVDLKSAFTQFQTTLNQISTQLQDNQATSTQIMRSMLNELSHSLPHMGLEEDQEALILDKVEKAIVESGATIDVGKGVYTSFHNMLQSLAELVTKQDEIMKQLTKTAPSENENDPGDILQEIELF